MATDEARLLVRIEAQMRSFERAMQKASGDANKAAGRIERRFKSMERRVGAVGIGLARALVGPLLALATARGAQQAADTYTRIENSLKVAGVAAEDMAGVYDRLFAAAQRNAAPVESLVELYSRAALVQKELNVSSEELMRFTEGVAAALRVSGKSAAESSGALLQLSQALGSGVVRAEEFNSILEGALPVAQAAARGLLEAGGSVAKLRSLVIDGKVSSEAFFRAFEAGQGTLEATADATEITLGGAMTQLRNRMVDVVGKFDDMTGASDALKDTINEVAEAFAWAALNMDKIIGPLQTAAGWMDSVEGSAYRLAYAIGLLGRGDLGVLNKTLDDVAANDRIARAFEDAQTTTPLKVTVSKPVSLGDYAAPAKRGGGGGSRKSAADTYQSDIDRIRQRTEALRLEAEMVGRSTYEVEKARAALELENEAKRAGLAITPERTAQIGELAGAYALATVELERLREAEEDSIARMDEIRDLSRDVLGGFISDLQAGKSGAEALAGALQKVADKLLDIGVNSVIEGLFGASGTKGGGGFLSTLFGGLFGGFRQHGGPVSPGKAYVVGEKGPEMLVPSSPGHVVPNGGAGGNKMALTVNVQGANGDAHVISLVRQGVAQGIASYDRMLPGKMGPMIREAQVRQL